MNRVKSGSCCHEEKEFPIKVVGFFRNILNGIVKFRLMGGKTSVQPGNTAGFAGVV